ncbi:MAG: LLM class flavin-dependent oxidoreductase [bacterium]|nr:LLM class flavin-dependent oxidoreductase [bacterium]
MKFSVWPALERSWGEVLELARRSEETGWDGVWVADHFMVEQPDEGPTGVLEVWSTLAGLSAATDRITLGSLVCSVTYRHPAVLASAAVTCDHISKGRFVLGVGAGWQENEHQAYGFELGDLRTRSDRLEDGCRAIRGLLDGESWTMKSPHFVFDAAPRYPKPVQERLPLLVGGKGERRTLRTAAMYADWWNAWVDAEALRHKRRILRQHCDKLDRDPDEVSCSTQAFLCLSEDRDVQRDFVGRAGRRPTLMGSVEAVTEQVGQLQESGAAELIIPDWTYESLSRRDDELDQFITEVAPDLR